MTGAEDPAAFFVPSWDEMLKDPRWMKPGEAAACMICGVWFRVADGHSHEMVVQSRRAQGRFVEKQKS